MRRVGKFGAVGVLNTLVDFTLFNILSGLLSLSILQANIISTTIAMVLSFMANKHVVFKHKTGSVHKQAIIFLAITAFGLYVLQNGTIKILTDIWLWPVGVVIALAHAAGITGHDQFLIKNSAKGAATIVSLTWNYVMYKKVVFR